MGAFNVVKWDLFSIEDTKYTYSGQLEESTIWKDRPGEQQQQQR